MISSPPISIPVALPGGKTVMTLFQRPGNFVAGPVLLGRGRSRISNIKNGEEEQQSSLDTVGEYQKNKMPPKPPLEIKPFAQSHKSPSPMKSKGFHETEGEISTYLRSNF
jgi:hypothetical protein